MIICAFWILYVFLFVLKYLSKFSLLYIYDLFSVGMSKKILFTYIESCDGNVKSTVVG